MKNILVIDGNNLAYRIYSSFTEGNKSAGLLTNSVGLPTTVIFGFLRAFDSFTKVTSVDSVVVCWDVKGGSKFRKSIYPGYKGNRSKAYKDMQDYFIELEATRSYMKTLGINQAPMEGIEADDVIGYISKKLAREGNKVIIMSDDRDYYQLLSKSIKMWRPCVNSFYTKRDLMHDYESWGKDFTPMKLATIAGFVGQHKDNIPGACDVNEETGIPMKFGFGEAKVKALMKLSNWDLKMAKMVLKYEPPFNEKMAEQVLRNWDQIKLSMELMRIRTKDSDYTSKELKKIHKVCDVASNVQTVKASKVTKLIRDLEILKVKPIPVLSNIGIDIVGASGKKYVRKIKIGDGEYVQKQKRAEKYS